MRTVLLKDQLRNSFCSKLKLKSGLFLLLALSNSTCVTKDVSENTVCLTQVALLLTDGIKSQLHVPDLVHITTLHIDVWQHVLWTRTMTSEYLKLTRR